jgi:hypothetical protein
MVEPAVDVLEEYYYRFAQYVPSFPTSLSEGLSLEGIVTAQEFNKVVNILATQLNHTEQWMSELVAVLREILEGVEDMVISDSSDYNHDEHAAALKLKQLLDSMAPNVNSISLNYTDGTIVMAEEYASIINTLIAQHVATTNRMYELKEELLSAADMILFGGAV